MLLVAQLDWCVEIKKRGLIPVFLLGGIGR
jgi:hypothetical protein